ncbi:UNVERIFIED_CONTAM: hypothetical protein PYX00_009809 [Menopon gallinae]|uniref:NAD(+) ADP-ribosyltransferase n=1 Tax=Menopon gallinae TaxID=328185 RepID=A0AAW2HCG9_9NEOP
MAIDERIKMSLFYEKCETEVIYFDIYTAASVGDLSYFTKYAFGSRDLFSVPNKSGWTPIMYACARGHALLVSYLIMCGAKTDTATKSKITPLMLAISSGDFPTMECVFNPVDLESRDYKLWTALFYAVYFQQEKSVEFLLSKGANVNVADYQNETPLLLAVKSGCESIVNLLLKTAKNLDVKSFKNESAIMLAKESKNTKLKEMILRRKEQLERSEAEAPSPVTPRNRFLQANKENVCNGKLSPAGKSPRSRSLLPIKISKSFTYSPNNSKSSETSSQPNRSIRSNASDHNKMSFWRMCITRSPVPSTAQYDVETLLSSLGLEKYWPIFRDEEVDFETLLTFNEDNLKDIGIIAFGPRKKILTAIHELRYYNEPTKIIT